MAGPSVDFTCRIELEFVLAMEADTLGDDLWDELPPDTVRPPSDETNDSLILEYAAYKLQEYQHGQRVLRYGSTNFNGLVAESQDSARESEWTMLHGPDLSELDRAECEAHIRHGDNGQRNCGSSGVESQCHVAPYFHFLQLILLLGRLVSARLLSPVIGVTSIDKIFPELRHIQNVLAENDPEKEDQQWQFHRATKKLKSCIPEKCRLRIQLSNDGRAIPFYTFRNLVVLWACFEQVLEQLQPRHCHRPPSISDRETFTRAINDCTNLSQLEELLGQFDSTDESAKFKPLLFMRPSICGRTQELHARSVEFRGHAGTLQANDVYWWVRLIVKIMQYAQWLTDKDFALMLYGMAILTDLLELIGFPRRGMEFYLERMKELVRMEKVAGTEKVTIVEELGQIEEKPAPPYELARIHELEFLEGHLVGTEEKPAPVPWSP